MPSPEPGDEYARRRRKERGIRRTTVIQALGRPVSTSRATSRDGALCVSQPTEIRSTPVSATSRTFSGRMPPEASVSGPAARAPHGVAQRREVHVVEQHGVDAERERLVELLERVDLDLDLDQVPDAFAHARARPRAMPPASATWLSLISTASSSPKRWLLPPPRARRTSRARAGPAWSCACRRRGSGRPREPRHGVARGGGDAAEVAEQVERRALGR